MTPVSGSISTSATWQPLGKAGRHRLARELHVERFRRVGRQVEPGAQPRRKLYHADRAVGARDDEAAARELDVGCRCFEHMGRGRLALLDDLVDCGDHRHAARRRRARAAGAAAGNQLVAVALEKANALKRHAEPLREDLRECRGMALAVIERPGDEGHGAVRLEADAAHFLVGRRGDFEIAADRDAAQPAAFLALPPSPGKTFPVGKVERVLEHRREIAGVVGLVGCRRERNFSRPDVVAPAQFQPIDTGFARRGVDQPLHEIIAFGTPGAAIGADIAGVGEGALRRDLDQRRAIDADHVFHGIHGRRQRRDGPEIGAHIAGPGEPDGEKTPIGVERQFGDLFMVAAVTVGEEARRTLVGPFDRPVEEARGMEQAHIFRIGLGFHAERAADIAGQHPEIAPAEH